MVKLFRSFTGAVLLFILMVNVACENKPNDENESKQVENEEQAVSQQNSEDKQVIVFFGNSLTAGYGLEPEEAFPAIIQRYLDSLGYNYNTVNAGVSGETTASGNSRVDWILKQPMDIFVLELGANDGLRGIDPVQTTINLQSIIDKVKAAKPEVTIVLAGMQVPPNMGADYSDAFRNLYPELAIKNKLPLIEFLLEGVGGDPTLNLPDGIHPTADGHQIVADNVWYTLKDNIKTN